MTTLIKVIDPRCCGHTQPVALDQSHMTVDEHKCVLIKGHLGFHTDGNGRAWANLEYLRDKLERENSPVRIRRPIISLPNKK